MIFVTTGSQKFQFNRLLKKIDELVADNIITDEVFAQTGYSDYQPTNYKYKDFLGRDEFADNMSKSTIVITHGGTGAIIGAVKKQKKVIAVPRLAEYGEHVDDHQKQIIKQFEDMNLIESCADLEELAHILCEIEDKNFREYQSNTTTIIEDIEGYLNGKG